MSNPLPPTITFSSSVIFQALDDEAVLLDMDADQYFALNDLGMRIWQLLSENSSTDHAIQQLLQEYDVDKAALHQDMAEWINEVIQLGLATAGE